MSNNTNKLFKSLSLLCAVSLLSACATKQEHRSDIALKPGQARIAFQQPNRVPNIFKEKIFGRISSLTTESGIRVEMNRQNNHVSHGFTDVTPGTYTLKAECDPVKNYSGEQINWLTNYTITLRADQIVRLGCEYFDADKSEVNAQALISYEDKSVWQTGKSDANKKVRRVRLVELSSRQATNY